MNITAAPEFIPISWQDYLARNYDHTLIPWARYRYSGTGVVKVSPEATRNIRIGKKLSRLFEATDPGVVAYTNSISIEVERSQKEERIPDVLVISKEYDRMLDDDAPGIITLNMPAPILVVEVVSPSSKKDDIEDKPFEYMERGVGEYMSVDWRKEVVAVWSRNEDGNSYNYNEFRPGEMVLLKSFPKLSLSVDDVIMG